jgi:prefoldin subunit 5
MYVPGKISKPEQPLIDIGTGYYAENVSVDNLVKRFKWLLSFII